MGIKLAGMGRVFGLNIPPAKAFNGLLNHSIHKMLDKQVITSPLSPQAEMFQKLGFCLIPEHFDDKTMKSLKKEFEVGISREDIVDKNGVKLLKYLSVPEFLKVSPTIAQLMDDNVSDLLRSYYQTDYFLDRVEFWRTSGSQNGETGIRGGWHTDFHNIDTVKAFILLSDVEIEDGPTAIFDQNHSAKMIEKAKVAAELKLVQMTKDLPLFYRKDWIHLSVAPKCVHAATWAHRGRQRDAITLVFRSGVLSMHIVTDACQN